MDDLHKKLSQAKIKDEQKHLEQDKEVENLKTDPWLNHFKIKLDRKILEMEQARESYLANSKFISPQIKQERERYLRTKEF